MVDICVSSLFYSQEIKLGFIKKNKFRKTSEVLLLIVT